MSVSTTYPARQALEAMTIARRSLIVAGGAFLLTRNLRAEEPPPYIVPSGNALGFSIVRHDCEIGKHILNFEPDGDNLTVQVAVDIAVGIGPIVLYRYTHRATEVWRGGQLFSVNTETNDDGKLYHVTAMRSEAGLIVEGQKAPRYIAPDDALPATHWNRRMLDGPLINTQYGDLLHPKITPLGQDLVPVASGTQIPAHHFAFSGDATLDTWYDEKQSWAALTFKAGDKSEIRYERI
jgi:hypothetical protein